MKLGPHVIRPTPEALTWARQAGVVKQIDGTEALGQAPPDAVRIFRHYFADQQLDADPQVISAAILNALKGYRHPRLYVEVWNEVHPTRDQMCAVINLLHRAGVKVAIGSWGTGDYTAEDWEAARNSGADAIAVHCYWAERGFTRWNALRYRQFWRSGDPPVIITECGRDRVRDGNGGTYVGQGGWRRDGISAEQYVAELIAYDTELQRDSYMIGATVFTAGATDDWRDFDTDGITDPLLARLSAVRQTGGTAMALKDQFPNEYAAWVAAGGVENNFLTFLVGQGKIKPTKEIVKKMAGEVIAKATELQRAVDALPLP
ncbi:MAG: hypothetical protein IRY83_04160 [Chloroflexi bacterium]|nr:hypothetical protein [Chloroflexota bacterium]